MEVFSPSSSVLFYVVCRDCVIDVLICVGDLTNSSLHFDYLLTLIVSVAKRNCFAE